jgi:hypothetical protein
MTCPSEMFHSPAQNSLGEDAAIGGIEPYRYLYYKPLLSVPSCPFCGEPVIIWKAHGNDKARAVAIIDGEARFCHIGCLCTQLGRRTRVQGAHTNTEKAAPPQQDEEAA